MNDFERKLAAQPFRTPPADLRRAVLAAAEPAPRATWREWLWPSPAAWGALAALWLAFFAIEARDRAATPAPPEVAAHPSAAPLLIARSPEALRHALELTN